MDDQTSGAVPDDATLLQRQLAESQQRELQLLADLEQVKQLFEQAPFSYLSLDENGCFIEVNQTWLDKLGYARGEVLGRPFVEFMHPDWQPYFAASFARFKTAGSIEAAEFAMVRKDGSTMVVSFNGKTWQCESDQNWAGVDGFTKMLCVETPGNE